jgi:hypothetical protein
MLMYMETRKTRKKLNHKSILRVGVGAHSPPQLLQAGTRCIARETRSLAAGRMTPTYIGKGIKGITEAASAGTLSKGDWDVGKVPGYIFRDCTSVAGT